MTIDYGRRNTKGVSQWKCKCRGGGSLIGGKWRDGPMYIYSCEYHITCVGLSSKSHWLGFTNYSTTRHLILIAYLPDINVRFMVF